MTGERESREELLEEIAELRYRARVLSQLGAAIIIVGPDDGAILYTNAQCDAMLGYEPGELAGNHISVVNAPGEKTPAETADDVMQCLNDTGRWSGEIKNIRKDGGTFWCHVKVVVVDHPEYGKVWAAVHEDITERKRAEEELRESEQRHRGLLGLLPDIVYRIDQDGYFTQLNSAIRMLGYEPSELIGEHFSKIIHPDDVERVSRATVLPGLEGKITGDKGAPKLFDERRTGKRMTRGLEVRLNPKKGHRERQGSADIFGSIDATADVTATGYYDAPADLESKRFLGTVGAIRDITDRKQAEEALRRRTHDLGERVKELHCLYRLATLVEQPGVCLGDVLQGLVDIMPSSWQHPEVTCARITFEGTTFSTANFRESAWRQTAAVSVHGEAAGEITVCYLEEEPAADEGPFLAEERTLIDALAERLGRTVERIRAEEELSAHREQLRSLASELSLAEERERRRIAAGLHDNLTQDLIATSARLAQCPGRMTDPKCAKCVDDVQEHLAKAVREVRTLTFELGSPILYELGLEAALEELVEEFQEKHGIRSEFEDDGKAKPLGPDLGALVFRAVRELLVNVVKHAKADRLTVSTISDDEGLKVVVEDDGVGFDTAEAGHAVSKLGAFGLFGIRERLAYLGGGMRLESEPGRGARITLVVPLKDEQETDAEYST